jgi:3-hydroxymyristoyl/3-hydroxydecanoyl-(acyl carrier protein) dehydratase
MSHSSPAGSPHRFPFVLFDRASTRGTAEASAIRLVSAGDALCEGAVGTTFAQSLLIEAMAQAATLFAEEGAGAPTGLLAGLSGVTFGRPPRPGDRLAVEARLAQRFGGMIRVSGRVTAGDDLLAEGDVLIALRGSEASPEAGDE